MKNYDELRGAWRVLKNFSAIGRAFVCHRKTVSRAVRELNARKPAKRTVRANVRNRQKLVRQLASQETRSGQRVWRSFGSCREIANALLNQHNILCSARTVQRDLHTLGYRSYVRRFVPTRDPRHFAARASFARRMLRGCKQSLRRIVFTDESWVCTNESGHRREWAPKGKRHLVNPRERRARWNVPALLVWGAIGVGYRSKLVIFPSKVAKDGQLISFRLNAQGYIRRCLSSISNDLLHGNRTLLHDGARSHASRDTRAYLLRKRIRVVDDFPPYSPDLNCIEYIWAELKRRVGGWQCVSVAELCTRVRQAWDSLPQSVIDQHCIDFEKKLKRCVARKGQP